MGGGEELNMYREELHVRPIISLRRIGGIKGKKQLMDWVERLILLAADPKFTRKELRALRKGFRDIKAGHTTPIKDIHNLWKSVL